MQKPKIVKNQQLGGLVFDFLFLIKQLSFSHNWLREFAGIFHVNQRDSDGLFVREMICTEERACMELHLSL